MNRHRPAFLIVLTALGLICYPWARGTTANDMPPQTTIACSVLEAHTSREFGITAAVFHQASKNDAARFGALLRSRGDASVQFQTSDGVLHKGSVARLKSSFGRGLLLFPAGSAQLKEKDAFLLKFE